MSQTLHSQLPATRVWGFSDGTGGGGYPGPTIEATSGVPIEVTWKNDLRGTNGNLRTTHALAVDGQVIGHWKRADGDATTLEAQLSRPLRATEQRGLRAEIQRYGRFLGVRAALRNVRGVAR